MKVMKVVTWIVVGKTLIVFTAAAVMFIAINFRAKIVIQVANRMLALRKVMAEVNSLAERSMI